MMSKLQSIAAVATIIGVIIAAIALLPAFGQWLAPRVPTSSSTATSTPLQDLRSEQLPTNVATMVPTSQVLKTKTQEPSSPTTAQASDVSKLSGVSLRPEDLSSEFKQMPQDELLTLGFRLEDIAEGYSGNFTGVHVIGYTAYRTNTKFTDAATDPTKFTMVESYIIAPLDKADISKVDLLMQNPKAIAEFFSGAKTDAPIKILADLPAIGDSALGLETELVGDWGLQVINARRQNAWLIIHVYYVKGQRPLVNIGDLASVLDNRIKTAYGQ